MHRHPRTARRLFVPVLAGLGLFAAAAAPAPRAADTPLLDAMPFDTWTRAGAAARFEVEPDEVIVGRGPIPANGFLVSPRPVGDFRLAVDVRLGSDANPRGEKMNSGIQFRSRVADGTITGLQCEIDPTPRRWSGGVYDERGRGWLAPLAGDEAAQAAFRLGEWNRYEIECIGPRVRTRVNGVACAEWFDGTAAGLLAFQVHGGSECEVRFRAPRIEELGAHAWRALAAEGAGAGAGEPVAWVALPSRESRGVRVAVSGSGRMLVACGADEFAAYAFEFSDAPKTHAVELLWLDGRGAIVVDGRRVARLDGMPQPTRVMLRGGGCVASAGEELVRAAP